MTVSLKYRLMLRTLKSKMFLAPLSIMSMWQTSENFDNCEQSKWKDSSECASSFSSFQKSRSADLWASLPRYGSKKISGSHITYRKNMIECVLFFHLIFYMNTSFTLLCMYVSAGTFFTQTFSFSAFTKKFLNCPSINSSAMSLRTQITRYRKPESSPSVLTQAPPKDKRQVWWHSQLSLQPWQH